MGFRHIAAAIGMTTLSAASFAGNLMQESSFVAAQNIDFMSTAQGNSGLRLTLLDAIDGSLESTAQAAEAPLVLVLSDPSDAGAPSEEPEPAAARPTDVAEATDYAPVLAGLGVIGFLAMRRKGR